MLESLLIFISVFCISYLLSIWLWFVVIRPLSYAVDWNRLRRSIKFWWKYRRGKDPLLAYASPTFYNWLTGLRQRFLELKG